MPWYIALGASLAALLLLPLVIMLMSSVYSLMWAMNTSSTIALERERGNFDLLGLLPAGPFGASWAIFTGYIHRYGALTQLSSFGFWAFRLLFIFLVIDFLRGSSATLSIFQAENITELIDGLTLLGGVSLAVYADHVQSIVIGGLVSMLVPTFARSRFDVQFWAVVGLMMLLVTTGLLAILVGFGSADLIGKWLHAPLWITTIGEILLSLVAFCAIREGVTVFLWEQLKRRLNMDSTDFDFVRGYRV
jgi:hypothetical protein